MTELDPHRIAVIIPAYNAAGSIVRAIDSVLSQNLPEGLEVDVVVVDDCSTDKTAELVLERAKTDPRLTFARQSENAGPSAARNRALELTNAAWFTPLDSDDFMLPDRLKKLHNAAVDGNLSLVADNLIISSDAAPQEPIRQLWPEKPDGNVPLTLGFFVEHNLTSQSSRSELGYIKPLMDRRRLPSGPVYRDDMRFGEDYDLYARMLADGARACLIDAAGYYAVQREGSLSRTPKAVDFQRLVETDRALLYRGDLSSEAYQAIEKHRAETEQEWAWVRTIEAVKKRSVPGFVSSFFISPKASLSVVAKLAEQVVLRSKKSLRGGEA